ncbi:MAG TPA: VOC family protein [Dehalococcoidia bacterium]|nr:VOC family protein [Dehalococcoidia bacterium]
MAIKVRELHHHAIRVPSDRAAEVQQFYTEVLGLEADSSRPEIPSVPGAWMYVGGEAGPTAQIHIMGVDGLPPFAKSADQDPTRFHVALAVDDVQAARSELDRQGVPYWVMGGVVGPDSVQIFLNDPAGNLIELHQLGSCRCNRLNL